MKSLWTRYSIPENVVNLSSVLLTRDQITLLGYGLSFSIGATEDNILQFFTDFAAFEYKNQQYSDNLATMKGFILHDTS